MTKIYLIGLVLLLVLQANTYQTFKVTEFKSYPHDKKCYTQGIFFLNETHLFQSCGLYDVSSYHVLKYENQQNGFKVQQTFKSSNPIDREVFLQGATWLKKTDNIYVLTWRQKKVYRLNRRSFQIEQIQKWQKDGWGLTSNDTHMFLTDGGPIIYVVDENFVILEEKLITQNGRKVYSINQLEYVVQSEKPYIYANVYMERRIIKIDLQTNKVVKEYDMLKIIQNQKNLKYDEVVNGIAYHSSTGKFLITGKNWGNFYLVNFD